MFNLLKIMLLILVVFVCFRNNQNKSQEQNKYAYKQQNEYISANDEIINYYANDDVTKYGEEYGEKFGKKNIVPLELLGEFNSDTSYYKETYDFNMDNFVWWTKSSTLSEINNLYKINVKNAEEDVDYIVSFGNELSELYYYNVEYDSVIDGVPFFYPYVKFKREHKINTAYVYKLNGHYNFMDTEFGGGEIFDYNENGKIPYIDD